MTDEREPFCSYTLMKVSHADGLTEYFAIATPINCDPNEYFAPLPVGVKEMTYVASVEDGQFVDGPLCDYDAKLATEIKWEPSLLPEEVADYFRAYVEKRCALENELATTRKQLRDLALDNNTLQYRAYVSHAAYLSRAIQEKAA